MSMKLVMIPYGALPCSLKVFTINGQDAVDILPGLKTGDSIGKV